MSGVAATGVSVVVVWGTVFVVVCTAGCEPCTGCCQLWLSRGNPRQLTWSRNASIFSWPLWTALVTCVMKPGCVSVVVRVSMVLVTCWKVLCYECLVRHAPTRSTNAL